MSTYTQEKASASEANPYHIHPLADKVPRTALRGLADKLAKTAHIPSQELLSVKGMSGFVVLCRRHAVCLPALLWQKREKGA